MAFMDAMALHQAVQAELEKRGDPRFYNLMVNHKMKKCTYEFKLFWNHTRIEHSYYRAYRDGKPADLRLDWELAESAALDIDAGLIVDMMMTQAWHDIMTEDIPGAVVISGYYEQLDGVKIKWLKPMLKSLLMWTLPSST